MVLMVIMTMVAIVIMIIMMMVMIGDKYNDDIDNNDEFYCN